MTQGNASPNRLELQLSRQPKMGDTHVRSRNPREVARRWRRLVSESASLFSGTSWLIKG